MDGSLSLPLSLQSIEVSHHKYPCSSFVYVREYYGRIELLVHRFTSICATEQRKEMAEKQRKMHKAKARTDTQLVTKAAELLSGVIPFR